MSSSKVDSRLAVSTASDKYVAGIPACVLQRGESLEGVDFDKEFAVFEVYLADAPEAILSPHVYEKNLPALQNAVKTLFTTREGTQLHGICLVVGSPRSGKTHIASYVLPSLASEMARKGLLPDYGGTTLPVVTLYLNLLPLIARETPKEKEVAFWGLLCRCFGEDVAPYERWFIVCARMKRWAADCRRAGKIPLLVLDEIRACFTCLDAEGVDRMCSNIHTLLSPLAPRCIITGIEQASLLWALYPSPVETVSGVTDEQALSSIRRYYSLTSEEWNLLLDSFQLEFGHLTCADVCVLRDLARVAGGPQHSLLNDYVKHVFYIYGRDILPLLRQDEGLRWQLFALLTPRPPYSQVPDTILIGVCRSVLVDLLNSRIFSSDYGCSAF